MSETSEGSGELDPTRSTQFLASCVQRGDVVRFKELYDRVEPTLYAWTRLRLLSRPDIGVDDVMQEVWLRALQGIEDYDVERSFRSWVLGIAKNVVLQHCQKRSSGSARSLGSGGSTDTDSAAFDLIANTTSVSMRVSRAMTLERFVAYVEELDEDDRTLVICCGLEEQTHAQAADRLGISVDAVGKRWQSLRARLRTSGVLEALELELPP